MPEVKQHYDNLAKRQTIITYWEALGYRMLHDDFDSDWKRGDEPHGVMTFTNEPEPVAPDTAIHFTPGTPGSSAAKRLDNIEKFLTEVYP